MKTKNWVLLILVILIELTAIGFLAIKVRDKQKKVLSAVTINPIKKESITFNPGDNLEYFYEPVANSQDSFGAEAVTNTINADSLNERSDYTTEKPKNVYRIITLGDSFTFGMFVNTKDNWTEKLEDLLNKNVKCQNISKFEVINLGVIGYDIEYSLRRYKIRGEKYSPDLILWLLKDDDFEEIREEENRIQPEVIQTLDKEGIYENLVASDAAHIWDTTMRNAVLKTMNIKYGQENLLSYQKAVLEKFRDYYSGKLIIFDIMPLKEDYKKIVTDLTSKYDNSTFVDHSFTAYNSDQDAFPGNFHPTVKGHKIIADDLFSYLTKNTIIPCD